MASDKKPSIYDDRGNIGSSDKLDEYGVWVKGEPQDLSSASAGKASDTYDTDDFSISDIEELPELDAFQEEASVDLPEDDFDIPDMDSDINGSMDMDSNIIETTEEDESDGNVFNFGDLTGEIGSIEDSIEDSMEDSVEGSMEDLPMEDSIELSSMDFADLENSSDPTETDDEENDEDDDVSEVSLEDFIGPIDNEPEEYAPEAPGKKAVKAGEASPPDLSTQLLMKIADELSSIRAELSSLKKEFTGFRVAPPPAEMEKNRIEEEEDDEKISLTGAELINIMNTADFTEETGKDASVDLMDDAALMQGEDTISFDAEDDGEIALDASEEAVPAPENAEFLAEEPLIESLPDSFDENDIEIDVFEGGGFAAAELSEDISADLQEEPIDFSEAVIDEPDLSSDILDNPIEEPSLEDITISLDIADLEAEDLEVEGLVSEEALSGELETEEFDSLELGSEEMETLESVSAEPDANLDLELDLEEEDGDSFMSEIPSDIPSEIPEGFVVEAEESQLFGEGLELGEDLDIGEGLELGEDLDIGEGLELGEDLDIGEGLELGEDLSVEEDLDIIAASESMNEELEEIEEIEEFEEFQAAEIAPELVPDGSPAAPDSSEIPFNLKQELRTVLSYMDQLLESLPDEKIEEFARSDYYDTYKKLFKELGLV